MRVRLIAAGGVLMIVAALVLAFKPFQHTIDLNGQELDAPLRPTQCRAPIVGAWNTDDKGQIALWAVTVGTNMQGYTGSQSYEVVGGVEPYCAVPARQRLGASSAMLLGGAGLTAFGWRRSKKRTVQQPATSGAIAGSSL